MMTSDGQGEPTPVRAVSLSSVGLIVLAAGRSSRMGVPKALAMLGDRPLLAHVLRPNLLRQLGDAVVVLGHHAEAVRPLVEECRARHALNPDPDGGRTGSVQTGLRALRPGLAAALVQPVDCPIIAPATYLALVAALDADPLTAAHVIVPSYGGKGGHPPLISAAIFPHILAAPADQPLRGVLQAPGFRRRLVEVDDPGVLVNFNSPEDLRAIPFQ